MSKIFEAIGYIAAVLAAAFGIIFLINKLTDREIDEELEAEVEELDLEEDGECECAECADAEPVEIAE